MPAAARAKKAVARPAAKKPATSPEKVEVRNPNTPSYRGRVDKTEYGAMRKIVLKVIPRKKPGMTQAEMFDVIEKLAGEQTFPGTTCYCGARACSSNSERAGSSGVIPKPSPALVAGVTMRARPGRVPRALVALMVFKPVLDEGENEHKGDGDAT